jgi:protein SCO1/2
MVIIVAGVIFTAAAFLSDKYPAAEELPELFSVPGFRFVTADGAPFGLQEMEGKINVVDFMFTRCMGPCPVMSAKMKILYEEFADAPQVQFISISVDPENDTAEVLNQYASDLGVQDDRWVFLREDDIEKVATLCEKGFKLAAEDLPIGHPVNFILVDENGVIRGYYDGTDDSRIDVLKKHIRQLLKSL